MLENHQVQPADDDAELCEPSPQEVYGFLPNKMADELLLEEAAESAGNGKTVLVTIVDSYSQWARAKRKDASQDYQDFCSILLETSIAALIQRVGSRPDAIRYWVDHHE